MTKLTPSRSIILLWHLRLEWLLSAIQSSHFAKPVVHSILILKCILILLWERFLEIERLGWTMAVFINEHISQRELRTEKWMGRSWKRNSLPPSSSAIRGMQRQTIVGEVSEYWREEYAGGGGGRYFPQNPTRILTTCWQTISGEKFVVTNTNLWDRQSGFQCSVHVQCIFISHCWTEFTHSLLIIMSSPLPSNVRMCSVWEVVAASEPRNWFEWWLEPADSAGVTHHSGSDSCWQDTAGVGVMTSRHSQHNL